MKPAPDSKITKKSAMVIIKAVTGLNSRPGGACFKLLRGRFQVQFKSLEALTASQIMEVTARKLITHKYVSFKHGVSYGDVKNADITVQREIDL